MTSKIDVFVSYKQEERTLMRKVVDGLHKAGYSAVADINIGNSENFSNAIDQMIRTARLTVTLWTEKSAESEWVRNESRLAMDLEDAGEATQWLGVLVEDVHLKLPPGLRDRQMLNLAPDGGLDDAGLARLVTKVSKLLGAESQLDEEKARGASIDATEELTLFEAARNLDEPEAWELYLEKYGEGRFASIAERERTRSRQRWRRPFRRSNLGFTFGWLGAAVGVAGLGATVFGMTQGDDPTPVVIGVPEDTHQAVLDEREQLEQALLDAADNATNALTREANRLRDLLATTEAALAEAERNTDDNGETVSALDQQVTALRTQLADIQTLLDQAAESDEEAIDQLDSLNAALESAAALERERAEAERTRAGLELAEARRLADEAERLAEEAEVNAIPANLQCNDETGADGVLFLETCLPLTTTSLGVYGPDGRYKL